MDNLSMRSGQSLLNDVRANEKTSEVANMIEERPEINEWTKQDVNRWIELSGLGRIQGIQEVF